MICTVVLCKKLNLIFLDEELENNFFITFNAELKLLWWFYQNSVLYRSFVSFLGISIELKHFKNISEICQATTIMKRNTF